jgi:mannose-6-phosphate isomerase
MANRPIADPRAQLEALHGKLIRWLVEDAYPRWAQHGIDAHGGSCESLGQDSVGTHDPRRARVPPRQAYAFAHAPALGWRGDARGIVRRGMDYFMAHYQRADGLFRTLADAGGAPLDETALLYDQAFALLGYAAAAAALDARDVFEARALKLRSVIESRLGAGDGAFYSGLGREERRDSNPHMHLLEACLAWAAIGIDASWSAWVGRLVDVAVLRLVRKSDGAVGEFYTAAWQPMPGIAGRVIEPGHQFEWAWLLLRCEPWYRPPLRETALRLLMIGETHGVHQGFAVNQLLDDWTVADADARLWPQTERLKAALLAASLTGDERYWAMAHAAAASLQPYLDTPLQGLWYDVRRPSGEFPAAAAPASTFYHLVGAIVALDTALRRTP